MIENLTYDQLAAIQIGAQAIAGAMLIIAAIYLVLGLISPSRLGVIKRRWIVLRSFGIVVLALALVAGTLFFTHSHANGPHAFKGYLEDYIRHECRDGKDLPACKDPKFQTPPRSERKVRGYD